MTANDGIVLVTGGSRGIGAASATPADAGFIAGSTWDAYGGLREAPGARDTRL